VSSDFGQSSSASGGSATQVDTDPDTGSDAGGITTPPSVAAGDVIGQRYRLRKKIGSGGMGEVWEGEHITLQQRVAVKILPEPGGRSRRRFLREARMAAQLRHPGIVFVHDFDINHDGTPYIIMEYLAGESLSSRIKREGCIGLASAVDYLRTVVEIVGFAHDHGVVHRDLKPSNIFLAQEAGRETVKIIDFGIAKMYDTDDEEGLTADGAFLGTPGYVSPEQIRGEAVDGRSDIYSLGCVAHHMLTGSPPFRGARQLLLLQHLEREPPQLTLPSDAQWLAETIAKAMSKEPSKRFKSAQEFLAALPSPGERLTDGPRATPLSQRARRALLFGLGLSIAAMAYFIHDRSADTPPPGTVEVNSNGPVDTGTSGAVVGNDRPKPKEPVPQDRSKPTSTEATSANGSTSGGTTESELDLLEDYRARLRALEDTRQARECLKRSGALFGHRKYRFEANVTLKPEEDPQIVVRAHAGTFAPSGAVACIAQLARAEFAPAVPEFTEFEVLLQVD